MDNWPEFSKTKINSIEQWKENSINYCIETFHQQGQLHPVFLFYNDDKKEHGYMAVGHFMRDIQHKDMLASMMAHIIKEKDAHAIMVISESWFKTSTPEDYEKYKGGISHLPDKEEVIMINFEDEYKAELIIYDIIRPSTREIVNGKKVRLEKREFSGPPMKSEGRFTNLLHRTPQTSLN